MGHRRKEKNKYQSYIFEYTKRRQVLIEKAKKMLSENPDLKTLYGKDYKRLPWYRKKAAPLTRKIGLWGRRIKAIEKRERKLLFYAQAACDFMGINVPNNCHPLKGQGKDRDSKIATTRNIFYKYMIDREGIGSEHLRKWTGVAQNVPASARNRFTRSFTKRPENRELYHRFLLFIHDLKEDNESISKHQSRAAA